MTDSNRFSYLDCRDQIKNGDILLYKGRKTTSRFIQWVIKSDYSHVGIAAWWNDRLMVLEAVEKGVIATPLSANIKGYAGDIELFTSSEEISRKDRIKMIQSAQKELGKEYSTLKMILFGFRVYFNSQFDTDDSYQQSEEYFCSHYVANTYNAVGIDLKEDIGDAFMSPKDIANSPKLNLKAILK